MDLIGFEAGTNLELPRGGNYFLYKFYHATPLLYNRNGNVVYSELLQKEMSLEDWNKLPDADLPYKEPKRDICEDCKKEYNHYFPQMSICELCAWKRQNRCKLF